MAGEKEEEVTADAGDTDAGDTDAEGTAGEATSGSGGADDIEDLDGRAEAEESDDSEENSADSDESPTDGDSLTISSDPGTKDALDQAAESFVEIERHLGHAGAGGIRSRAIDVARVSAEEVPEGFPYEVTTNDALALTLSIQDESEATVRTYFNWPGEEPDERLAQLLELADVPPDRFADLHGKPILLQVEDGHYVPYLPDELPRGDERAVWGILAGIAPNVLLAIYLLFGLGGIFITSGFILLWMMFTFVLLPISVYVDSWHLRTTTDWDGGPLFWAFFAMLPLVNVVVVPAYLIMRQQANRVV